MEKHTFFVVTYMLKFKDFSTKCLWFGSPWEMWILKLFRRHQFFEAVLILTVPGLRNIIFEEKGFFGKYFSKLCSETYFFRDMFFKKKCPNIFFGKVGLGATLLLGVGPGKLLPWFTPWFSNTFLVTKRVAVGATEIIPKRIAVIFHADAESEVKGDVASYFWAVF